MGEEPKGGGERVDAPSGSEEEEGGERTLRVLQTGSRETDGVGDARKQETLISSVRKGAGGGKVLTLSRRDPAQQRGS